MFPVAGSDLPHKSSDYVTFGFDSASTQVGTTSHGHRAATSSWGHRGGSSSRVAREHRCLDGASGGLLNDFQVARADAQQQCVLCIEDLNSFRISLERPLQTVYRALDGTDKDLFQVLGKIIKQLVELTESAHVVVKTHRVMARQIMCDLLPSFKQLTIEEGNVPGEAANLIASVQMVIKKMKHDAKAIRTWYITVLETVQYLISCTQVSLDFYEWDCSNACQDQAARNLKLALEELKYVHHVLADPSDFWLIFHVIELELGSIEHSTQFLSNALRSGYAALMPSQYSVACEALEHLCLQYLATRTVPVGLCM